MKRVIVMFAFFLGVMFTSQVAYSTDGGDGGDGCRAGGPGATSCTYTVTVGPVSTTYSVTCGNGYYACCKVTGANCVEIAPQ